MFDNQDRHEFDDQMALEVHSMKEHLFALLGKIQVINLKKSDRKFFENIFTFKI